MDELGMSKEKGNSFTKNHMWLDELSTLEAQEAIENETVIIFPVGSVEEHGSHLPLGTDSVQPEYIALEVSKKTGCLVIPSLRYGVCNSARNFPGTISIGFDSLYRIARDILSELVRNGFNRIIVLSGHAGSSHMVALRMAAQEIVMQNSEKPVKTRIMVLSDFDFASEVDVQSQNDGHAGGIETSRVMAIRPDLIKGKGKKGVPHFPRFEIVADPEKYFPTGVMGDPTTASEEKGDTINTYIIEQVTKLVEEIKK